MDGHRHVDDVIDVLDREIESLLSVDPSPEFLAKVRSRVAEETPHVSWFRWSYVTVATASALIIVMSVTWPSNESASPKVQEPQAATVVRLPPEPSVSRPEPVAEADRITRGSSTRVRRETVSRASDVERTARLVPVVAEHDAKAFDVLLSTIRDKDVVLVFNDDSPDSALSASTLAIAPIAIEPVAITVEGDVE